MDYYLSPFSIKFYIKENKTCEWHHQAKRAEPGHKSDFQARILSGLRQEIRYLNPKSIVPFKAET